MPKPKKRVLQLQKNAKISVEKRRKTVLSEVEPENQEMNPKSSKLITYAVEPVNERIGNLRMNSSKSISSAQDGPEYIIIDIDQLNELVKPLLCQDCKQPGLTVDLNYPNEGCVQKLFLTCQNCEDIGLDQKKKYITTSKSLDPSSNNHSSYDLNVRMSLAFVYLGLGYAAIEQFAMIMNIPFVCKNAYAKHTKKIYEACTKSVIKCVERARLLSKKLYEDLSVDESPAFVQAAASFDGSWLTRGHKSKYGFASAIDFASGYVLDYEVLSKYCHACTLAKRDLGKNSPEFATWFDSHKSKCSENHFESSGAMEKRAAEIIWKRSESYGFQFTHMISDGDSSTFSHLSKLNVYGADNPVQKEECVNHVQKRLRTALEKLVKESSKTGRRLGGKGTGTLKQTTVFKLSSYYKSAIYCNKNDPAAMKRAILATLYHSTSTDERPNHVYCPPGENSWCFYQRAVAKNEKAGLHSENVSTPIKEEYFKLLLPVYTRLSAEDLLERCIGCKTQNSNESLHNMIWHKCPKEIFVGKDRVEIAAALAICEYNFGVRNTVSIVLQELNMQSGFRTQNIGHNRDLRRLKQNDVRSTIQYKKNRKQKVTKEMRKENQKPDEAYKAGGF